MKYTILFFASIVAFFSVSCDNITEEITIHEDGSGYYKVYTDMLPGMMTMMGEISNVLSDSTDENIDSISNAIFWEDLGGDVDSTFSFIKDVPIEIEKDKMKMSFLENANGFMRGSEETNRLDLGYEFTFSQDNELNFLVNLIGKSKAEEKSKGLNVGLSEPKVEFILTKASLAKTTLHETNGDIEPSSLKMIRGLFAGGVYRTVVHLPAEVKEVSGKYLILKEEKTVIFEYPLDDFILGELDSDFELIFD